MRWVYVAMFCGGTGLWLSTQYQVPQWLLWSLLATGTTMWGLAKRMEWCESQEERNHARSH